MSVWKREMMAVKNFGGETPESSNHRLRFWNGGWEEGRRWHTDLMNDILSGVDGKRVLDVGCGDLFYSQLPEISGYFVGLDVSRVALEKARKSIAAVDFLVPSIISRVDLVVASADSIPFKQDSFHAVASVETLTLLGDTFKKALGEMTRVSEKKVCFEVSDLKAAPDSVEALAGQTKTKYGMADKNKGINRVFFTKEGVDLLLNEAGLRPEFIGTREELRANDTKTSLQERVAYASDLTKEEGDGRIFVRAVKRT